MNTTVLHHADGALRIDSLPDGINRLSIEPNPGLVAARPRWATHYPQQLIQQILAVKGLYVCDEIMRDEDPRYLEHYLRNEVLGYIDADAFADKRVLDFGCGSGASTMVLARLLPPCEIVGIELEERLLEIARMRAAYFQRPNLRFLRSPAGDRVPDEIGAFDFIIFSAVFEHLLPHERRVVLPLVWRCLNPGGVLFLNQTPHRYSPVEIHTTGGVPLINYLPDGLALRAARRFSKYVQQQDDWETLLRRGIRGGSVGEILRTLKGDGHPTLLAPARGDRIDLWHRGLSARHARLKRGIWLALKGMKLLTRGELTPSLALAIRRDS